MKEFRIKDQTINVPTSWADVKLCEYEKWNRQNLDTTEGEMQFVADVCGLDIKDLRNEGTATYKAIQEAVAFAFDNYFEPQYAVKMDGEKFFISPSDKLTLGEWVDIDSVLNNEDEADRWAQALSIACRPVDEKYEIELSAKRVDSFRQLACDKALPLISFFLHKNKNLEQTLLHYSKVAEEANQFLKDTKTFAKSGAGTKRLPIWQRIKFYFLSKSLEKQLSRYSDLCSIK